MKSLFSQTGHHPTIPASRSAQIRESWNVKSLFPRTGHHPTIQLGHAEGRLWPSDDDDDYGDDDDDDDGDDITCVPILLTWR